MIETFGEYSLEICKLILEDHSIEKIINTTKEYIEWGEIVYGRDHSLPGEIWLELDQNTFKKMMIQDDETGKKYRIFLPFHQLITHDMKEIAFKKSNIDNSSFQSFQRINRKLEKFDEEINNLQSEYLNLKNISHPSELENLKYKFSGKTNMIRKKYLNIISTNKEKSNHPWDL